MRAASKAAGRLTNKFGGGPAEGGKEGGKEGSKDKEEGGRQPAWSRSRSRSKSWKRWGWGVCGPIDLTERAWGFGMARFASGADLGKPTESGPAPDFVFNRPRGMH